jgi:hypothetical protein
MDLFARDIRFVAPESFRNSFAGAAVPSLRHLFIQEFHLLRWQADIDTGQSGLPLAWRNPCVTRDTIMRHFCRT